MRALALTIALFLLAFPSLFTAAAHALTAEQLIAAMHERYAQSWYHSLTFEQQSITHKPDGTTSTETWHEALLLPGRLRIDFGDRAAGNGALFANNRQYIYRDGKLANERALVHPLLVLGFDVYQQPVETTLHQLNDLHIDSSVTHEETWDGRAVVVVGAKSGDSRAPQFWIDKERLYFVRLLQPTETDPKTTQDIRFEDYHPVEGGGWLAEHVSVYSEGKLVFEENYSDIHVNPSLADDQFDPQQFRPAKN